MLKDITYKKEALLTGRQYADSEYRRTVQSALEGCGPKFVPQRYHYVQVLDDQLKEKGILNESEIVNGLLDFGAQTQVGRLFHK
jgi:hypothetical protein